MIRTILATDSTDPDMNRAASEWAGRAIWDKPGAFDLCSTLSVIKDDDCIGVVVFHEWHEDRGTIEISAAGFVGWQSRRVVNEVFGFCFDAMCCQAVIARTSDLNGNAIANLLRLGFEGYLIPRVRGFDEGEVVFTMTEEAWRKSRLYKPRKDSYIVREAAHTGPQLME